METLVDRHLAAGMSPQAARRAAVAALGGPGGIIRVKEDVREGRIGAGIDALLLDLRYAWRGLWTTSGLTAVMVVTLALGIGANAAIFSVVRAMLLEPLPYRDADRLVFVWLDQTAIGYPRGPLSGPDLRDLRDGSTTCAEFGAIWATGTVALAGDGDPEQLRSAFVTTNFFQVLGAESALGRTFRAEDSAPGAPPTILLGWELFQRRFGGDPSIVGRQILVNDEPTTVIGVMPQDVPAAAAAGFERARSPPGWQPFWPDLEQRAARQPVPARHRTDAARRHGRPGRRRHRRDCAADHPRARQRRARSPRSACRRTTSGTFADRCSRCSRASASCC